MHPQQDYDSITQVITQVNSRSQPYSSSLLESTYCEGGLGSPSGTSGRSGMKNDVTSTPIAPSRPKRNVLWSATLYAVIARARCAAGRVLIASEAWRRVSMS